MLVKLPKKRTSLYLVLESKRTSNAAGRHIKKDDPKRIRKLDKALLKKEQFDE